MHLPKVLDFYDVTVIVQLVCLSLDFILVWNGIVH